MATKLSATLGTASGVTWMDIYERPAMSAKTLSTITEEDWVEVGGFREGTFNFAGDEMTVTEQKYENGQTIVSTTKDGTYGFEGNLANVAKAVCEKILCMKELSLSATPGGYAEKRTVVGYGDKVARLDNIMIRLRFEQGEWDSIIYPNGSLSSRFQGSGSSEDLVDISVQGNSSKSQDEDTLDQIYILVSRAKSE